MYIDTGYYPHVSVAPCPGHIQKEVVYCPDLRLCAFDIAISTHDQQQSRSKLESVYCATDSVLQFNYELSQSVCSICRDDMDTVLA